MEYSKLTNDYNKYLNSLSNGYEITQWKFEGNSDVAFGSPGGSWKGQEGFKFKDKKSNKEYLIRCIKDNNYIVLESFSTKRQIYNMDLSKRTIHQNQGNQSVLFESYNMTAGKGRVKKKTVQNTFKDLGVNTNIIHSVNDTIPDWEKLTTSLIAWAKYREDVKSNLNEASSINETVILANPNNIKIKSMFSLNQILFGPPGTGKTYNTINKALEIINDDEVQKLDWSNRANVKALFDKKMKEGQIVFTTFHQSMSYEEFIEGIKPIEPKDENESLTYKVEPGVFKKLSIETSFNLAKLVMSKEVSEALDFSNLYDMFIEEVQEKLINNQEVELKTKSGGTVLIDSISQQGNIIIKHHNGTRTYTVSKPRLTKLQSSITSLDSVSNINDEFREIIGGSNSSAYWSVLNAIKQITKRVNLKTEEKTYAFEDKVEIVKKMNKDDFRNVNGKKHILIIDEINRGNVSQIFGELITLIEEDKRLGKDEALEVTLPYSKEKFGVPPNLYIIGTMNTADRSVEALDTALRRRFSFTEMPPKPELLSPSAMITRLLYKYKDLEWEDKKFKSIENDLANLLGIDKNSEEWNQRKATWENEMLEKDQNDLNRLNYLNNIATINFEELLNTINNRIEVLMDSDHAIGHSYFIKIGNAEDFKMVMYNNVIPLLQEYFYGDYAKIGAVLGKGFIREKQQNNFEDKSIFADFYGFEDGDYQEKSIYEIVDYRGDNLVYNLEVNKVKIEMDFEKAIRLLMNLPIVEQVEN